MAIKIQVINLSRRRGDTYADQFQLVDENGDPQDIAGATFKLAVDPSDSPVSSANNKFELTGVIVDDHKALVEFAPTASQVDQDSVGVSYYDAQITYVSGRVRTFARGKYTIEQDIAK